MAVTTHNRLILSPLDGNTDPASISFVMQKNTDDVDWAGYTPVADWLIQFFTVVGTGSAEPLSDYISSVMDRSENVSTLLVYDITGHLDGSPAGSPVIMQQWTLGSGSSDLNQAEGVAATISFQSDYGTDVEFGVGSRPRSRDRNRVYLGPLNVASVQNEAVTNRLQFKPQFMTDCLGALHRLAEPINDDAGDQWLLQQWSRKNASVKLPTIAWMDDRPDYQRRRSDPTPGTKVFNTLPSA